MNWQAMAVSPAVERLGWTLVHFVWQGAVIAMALAVAMALMRRASASARYGVALAALASMLVAPAATFLLMRPAAVSASAQADPGALMSALKQIDSVRPAMPGERLGAAPGLASIPAPRPADWRARVLEPLRARLPWLVLGWLLGAAALASRQLAAWGAARRLTRRSVRPAPAHWEEVLDRLAARVGVSRPVRLLESALVEAPSLIGWLRPVILLPASALTGLLPSQIEAILAHELAHIRRCDYLVNIAQTIAETLLFYHPAVWLVGRWIRQERENCCDDLAIEVLGDRRGYALALTRMEELRTEASGYAMAMTGGHLMNRIRRMLGMEEAAPAGARWIAGALAALALTAMAIILAGSTKATAQNAKEAPGATLLVTPTAAKPTAAATPVEKLPGYVAFDPASIAGEVKPSVEVNMDPALLQVALGAAQKTRPQLAELGGLGLALLKVRVYEDLKGEESATVKKVAAEIDKLVGQGWSPIVRIGDESDVVNVLMKSEGNRIRGVVVAICDGTDFVYVNAVLDADAASVGAKLAPYIGQAMNGQFDVAGLLKQLEQTGGGDETVAKAAGPVTMETLKKQLQETEAQRQWIAGQVAQIEAKAEAMRKQAEALDKAQKSDQKPTDEQRLLIDAAREKIDALKAQMGQSEAERGRLETTMGQLQSQMDALNARMQEMNDKLKEKPQIKKGSASETESRASSASETGSSRSAVAIADSDSTSGGLKDRLNKIFGPGFQKLTADMFVSPKVGQFVISGSVTLKTDLMTINCDRMTIDQETRIMVASGAPVKLVQGGISGECNLLTYDIVERTSKLDQHPVLLQADGGKTTRLTADHIILSTGVDGKMQFRMIRDSPDPGKPTLIQTSEPVSARAGDPAAKLLPPVPRD